MDQLSEISTPVRSYEKKERETESVECWFSDSACVTNRIARYPYHMYVLVYVMIICVEILREF